MATMNTTLVINSKGGSGKTTVTTNLASFFASRQVPTTILDYDPQASSLSWLSLRDRSAAKVHGANAAPQRGGRIRGIEMHVPSETRQLLIDAPAGASGLLLQEMLARANCIVIPVAPSAFDIYATANFVKELLLVGRIRTRSIRLAVVANRVRSSAPVYRPLERFLSSLGLPFLTRISDSEVYVRAAETGLGVFDMDESAGAERGEFMPIVDWVGGQRAPEADAERKVIDLAQPRWTDRIRVPFSRQGLSSVSGAS
ncbi:MAG TPA: ParA family protein [Burkholderiales bacterium]|nr:ParA family protein [Burkholderiales bacterium]